MQIGINLALTQRNGGAGAPALNIDFAGTGVLPSTVTFSRGTNATLTGSNGLIQWAPHNLLTNSESFEAAAWGKFAAGTGVVPVVTPNAAVAPDGTTTADSIVFNRGAGNTLTDQAGISQSPTVSSGAHTQSVWLKAATPSDIGKQLALRNVAAAAYGIVTLTADWVRYTRTETGANSTWEIANRGTATADNTVTALVWGAQLNIGSTAQSYNSTTPKNLLGFTQEPENAAWTKSNSYVQQNLLTWSQDFDNAAWNKGNVTVSANATIAPDGSATADNLVTVATTAITGTFNGTGVASATNTQSFYVKQNTGIRYVQLLWTSSATSADFADFDLQTGTLTAGSYAAATISSVGNGWYRITLTSALSASVGGPWLIAIPTSTAGRGATYVGNGTDALYVWGAQLVQGSTAGDYTQTTSAAAPTRYLNWDGTLTGRKLVEDAAASTHQVAQAITTTAVPYTFTVYAKAGERSFVLLYNTDAVFGKVFNLASGTVGTGTVGTVTASIQNAGGGWYRCAITGTCTAAANNFRVYLLTSDTVTASYTGDGTSGIYVSDFQLSNSASVDPYVYNPQAAAASAAYYGPRFDYNPVTLASNGLLIEEQRTNLLTYSQDFTNAIWTKANITVTPNSAVAPDGTTTATTYAVTTTSTAISYQDAVATSTTLVYTIYVKQNTGPTDANTFAFFNNTTATLLANLTVNYSTGVVTQSLGTGATTTNVGNGWWRLSVPISSGVTVGNSVRVYPCFIGNAETAGESAFIWGAQLEAGSFATSYIPTVASQVTRNADSASMLGDNFYTWYNPNQGTLSAEVQKLSPSSVSTYAYELIGASANFSMRVRMQVDGRMQSVDAGAVQVDSQIQGTVPTTASKYAFAYQVNNYAGSANGGAVVTDTLGTVPPVSSLSVGSAAVNGLYIRSIRYYNTRLPDSTLQGLTV